LIAAMAIIVLLYGLAIYDSGAALIDGARLPCAFALAAAISSALQPVLRWSLGRYFTTGILMSPECEMIPKPFNSQRTTATTTMMLMIVFMAACIGM